MEDNVIRKGDKPSPLSSRDEESYKILLEFHKKRIADIKTWQGYYHNITIDENNILPVGFVKGYHACGNREILKVLNQITTFPNFCCSLYGPPGKESHAEAGVDTPAIYYSSQYNNVGTDCFVKSWGDFMMFVGWSSTIMDNLQMLVSSAIGKGIWSSGNDMLTDLFNLYGASENCYTDEYIQQTKKIRSIYTDIGDRCDYYSFVYKSTDIITSIQLSSEAKENIKNLDKQGLTPACQMHFGLGGSIHILKMDYGWDENREVDATFWKKKHPIFAVTPPIYAHKSGAFYDSQTNMIIGKRKQIVEFLHFLNQKKVFDEKDLRYLV